MLNPSTYEPSSSSDEESVNSDEFYERDYTNNIGYHRRFREQEGRFMNNRKYSDYSEIRNKYFSPDVRCDRIVVDSSNHSTTNKNEYIVRFDESKDHSTEGYGVYKNVIGFKLVSCCISNRLNTIHSNNNKITIIDHNSLSHDIELDVAVYTVSSLITHLENKLNTISGLTFSITADSEDVLTISETSGPHNFSLQFQDSLNTNKSSVGTLLGFPNDNLSGSSSHTGKHAVKLRTGFVDLVIPELPYMACKKNPQSKKLVERISLTSESDRFIFHSPEDYSINNYFTPINLDRITIQLFDENKDIPYNSLHDNFFEFEIITLHNTDIL